MKEKLLALFVKIFLGVFVLVVAGGLWYYTLGRKPKLLVSTAISGKGAAPSAHQLGAGEVLLVVENKATLFDTSAGKEKWVVNLAPAAAPTPPPATAPAPTPALGVENKKDDPMLQILQARVARTSVKLEQWAAQLEAKRKTRDTALKKESFQQEEAKYKAERAELDDAIRTLGSSAAMARLAGEGGPLPFENRFGANEAREAFRDGTAIWLLEGRSARLLDHANGRLTKELPLPGSFKRASRGPDCIYAVTIGDGGAEQVTRLNRAGDPPAFIEVAASADGGGGRSPSVESHRAVFSAHGSELMQLDVQLVEQKITEKQALKQGSVADWEEADKKTSGGWSKDAAVIAQAMANDAAREATGGKELIDESTYEVTLRRPFSSSVSPVIPFQVQGRPEVFSTASFDLIAAGRTLIAFDHANKKLWEAALAFPVATHSWWDEFGSDPAGSTRQPCLEDEQRLYFFDQATLTAFDRQTGKTRWRLPSVGIRRILLDRGDGFVSAPALYVVTANGSAETLQYSQQATAPTIPLIFKLEPATGKILWKVDKYEECFVAGGGVYATLQARNPNDLVDSVFQGGKGVPVRFKLFKLSARDGQAQWEWFQPRRPLRIEADRRKVTLLFRDELQVLTSLAF